MTALEQRLHEAYDAQHLPAAVRRRTLDAIEAARASQAEAQGDPTHAGVAADVPSATAHRPRVTDGSPVTAAGGLSATAAYQSRTPADSPAAPAASGAPSAGTRRFRRRHRRAVAALAACLLLVVAAFGALGVYRTPAAYVGISVNPSIELTVNPFGTVIAARGLNDDGAAVLSAVSLDNLSYDAALDRLVTSTAFAPYLTAEAFVDVSIESDDLRLGDDIAEQTDRALAQTPCGHRCHRADGTTCEGAGHGGANHGQGSGHGGASAEGDDYDGGAAHDREGSRSGSGHDGEGGHDQGEGHRSRHHDGAN